MAITFTTILHFLFALFIFALIATAIWYLLNAIINILPAPIQRLGGVIRAFVYLLLVLIFIAFLTGNIGGFKL